MYTQTVICIYIYIYIFRQHFFVNANFIEHNRHFMPTYSLLDPFEFPYYFYRIRGELIKVLSIIVCIPSTSFSDFYMSNLENRIFNSIKKPPIYLRYVDDILILTNNINEINILQDTFQNNSVLNFTHELNKNNKIY